MSTDSFVNPAIDSGVKRKSRELDEEDAQDSSINTSDRDIKPMKKRARIDKRDGKDTSDSDSLLGSTSPDLKYNKPEPAVEVIHSTTVPQSSASINLNAILQAEPVMQPSYVYDHTIEDEVDYSDGEIDEEPSIESVATIVGKDSCKVAKVVPTPAEDLLQIREDDDGSVTMITPSEVAVALGPASDPSRSSSSTYGKHQELIFPTPAVESIDTKTKAQRQTDIEAKKLAARESLKRNKEKAAQKPKAQYRTVGVQTEPIHNRPLYRHQGRTREEDTSLQPLEKVMTQVEATLKQNIEKDPSVLKTRMGSKTEWTEEDEKEVWKQEILKDLFAGNAWEAASGGEPMKHHLGSTALGRYNTADDTEVDEGEYKTQSGQCYTKNLSHIVEFDDSFRRDCHRPAQGQTFDVVTFQPFLNTPRALEGKRNSAFQTMTAKYKDAAINRAVHQATIIATAHEDIATAAYQGLAFAEVESNRTKIVHSEQLPLVKEKVGEDGRFTLDLSKIHALEVIAAKKENDYQVAMLPNIKERRLDIQTVPAYTGMSTPVKVPVIDISNREHESIEHPTLVTQDDLLPVAHVDWDSIDNASITNRWMRAENRAYMKRNAEGDEGQLPTPAKIPAKRTDPQPPPNAPDVPKSQHQQHNAQESGKHKAAEPEHVDAHRARASPVEKQVPPRNTKKRERSEDKDEQDDDGIKILGVANKKPRVDTPPSHLKSQRGQPATPKVPQTDEDQGFSIKGAGNKFATSQTPDNNETRHEATESVEHKWPAFLGGYKIEHNPPISASQQQAVRKDRSTQDDIDLSIDDLRRMKKNRNEREGKSAQEMSVGAIDKDDRRQGVPPGGDRYKPGTSVGRHPNDVREDNRPNRGRYENNRRDNGRPRYGYYDRRVNGHGNNGRAESRRTSRPEDSSYTTPAGEYNGGWGIRRGQGRGDRGYVPRGGQDRRGGGAFVEQYGHSDRQRYGRDHGQ
ncbi:hypothetical protein BDV96DRAFT_598305 [Lophiotrema nucula]|uniref:Uncharacterized protein n=1 Tax=Lophiotrema nucula TaxID=690887 RepID=A0A6A5ZG65_9PLEO|nr:hypothetical protein BDV96DRAFT_598305 [Lophiotrema nucula]